MNIVFKLMLFSIMLNFSVGIMSTAIVDIDGNPIFSDPSRRMGLDYDSEYTSDFVGELNESINPTSELEDTGNAIYRVLDMIGIGFIKKILNTIDKYMFGFINIIQTLIGGKLDSTSRVLIFGIMKAILTIGYIIGAWTLWTGKETTR